jgi:hypothetical protein
MGLLRATILAMRELLDRDNTRIEHTIQRLGHEGTNSIRADAVVLDVPNDSHAESTTDLVLPPQS